MTVLTVGVFDLLHYGHVELFRKAKELAGPDGKLIVGVQDDEHVKKYKPTAKLAYSYDIRRFMVGAIKYVDEVILHTDVDETVKSVDFDIFCPGGEQAHAGFQRAIKWCEDHGKKIMRIPRTSGISSTMIRGGIDAIRDLNSIKKLV